MHCHKYDVNGFETPAITCKPKKSKKVKIAAPVTRPAFASGSKIINDVNAPTAVRRFKIAAPIRRPAYSQENATVQTLTTEELEARDVRQSGIKVQLGDKTMDSLTESKEATDAKIESLQDAIESQGEKSNADKLEIIGNIAALLENRVPATDFNDVGALIKQLSLPDDILNWGFRYRFENLKGLKESNSNMGLYYLYLLSNTYKEGGGQAAENFTIPLEKENGTSRINIYTMTNRIGAGSGLFLDLVEKKVITGDAVRRIIENSPDINLKPPPRIEWASPAVQEALRLDLDTQSRRSNDSGGETKSETTSESSGNGMYGYGKGYSKPKQSRRIGSVHPEIYEGVPEAALTDQSNAAQVPVAGRAELNDLLNEAEAKRDDAYQALDRLGQMLAVAQTRREKIRLRLSRKALRRQVVELDKIIGRYEFQLMSDWAMNIS